MSIRILLCCDLDRTIIPNGDEPESPRARDVFRQLSGIDGVLLAYVSGRSRRLLEDAVERFDLPRPAYAIGDVGTSMFRNENGELRAISAWNDEISRDWPEDPQQDLAPLLSDLQDIELQPGDSQSRYKLSYYAPVDIEHRQLLVMVSDLIDKSGYRAELIWSIDELNSAGLLDIIPGRAGKYHAVKFLMQMLGIDRESTLFAGDSGNDLPVITSELKAVLVRNARAQVRNQALTELPAEYKSTVYLAEGGFMGMNGNYSAGVVEGVAHFFPSLAQYLEG